MLLPLLGKWQRIPFAHKSSARSPCLKAWLMVAPRRVVGIGQPMPAISAAAARAPFATV